MPVQFHEETKFKLNERRKLKAFIPVIFQKEGKAFENLDVIFCTDEYLLNVNREFLQHDYYTDIITFDLSENKKVPVTAELYISVDRVKENAQTMNVSFQTEMQRVIFHGALHLCGYKDKGKKAEALMREKEDQYLNLYSLYV